MGAVELLGALLLVAVTAAGAVVLLVVGDRRLDGSPHSVLASSIGRFERHRAGRAARRGTSRHRRARPLAVVVTSVRVLRWATTWPTAPSASASAAPAGEDPTGPRGHAADPHRR